MAESSNATFFPEILANADNVQFAEELVGDVMLRNSTNYVLNKTPVPLREFIHAFDEIAQRAVQCIEKLIGLKPAAIFHKIQIRNSVSSSYYSRFVYESALMRFAEGFDVKTFLIFCVGISKMAAFFYNSGILDAPDLAIMQIIALLEKYDLREGGWDALRRVTVGFDTMLRVSETTPQSTQINSIERLNLFVSSHEAINYSSSGESNVLKENNARQNQDSTLSKRDIFSNSKIMEFEENTVIDKSSQNSDFKSKSDCFKKFDHDLNVKAHEISETMNSGGDMDSFSSTDEFRVETSKPCQTSIFTITKESKNKLDLSSDDKSGANYPSMISDENILVNNCEPTEKLVPKTPDSNQTCVSYKRKLDFGLHKENKANAKNVALTDKK